MQKVVRERGGRAGKKEGWGVQRGVGRRSRSLFSGCALMHVSVLHPQTSHNPPFS